MLRNNCFHKEMVSVVLGAVAQAHVFGTLLELHFKAHRITPDNTDALLSLSSPKLHKLVDILLKNRPTIGEEQSKEVFVSTKTLTDQEYSWLIDWLGILEMSRDW